MYWFSGHLESRRGPLEAPSRPPGSPPVPVCCNTTFRCCCCSYSPTTSSSSSRIGYGPCMRSRPQFSFPMSKSACSPRRTRLRAPCCMQRADSSFEELGGGSQLFNRMSKPAGLSLAAIKGPTPRSPGGPPPSFRIIRAPRPSS